MLLIGGQVRALPGHRRAQGARLGVRGVPRLRGLRRGVPYTVHGVRQREVRTVHQQYRQRPQDGARVPPRLLLARLKAIRAIRMSIFPVIFKLLWGLPPYSFCFILRQGVPSTVPTSFGALSIPIGPLEILKWGRKPILVMLAPIY